MDALSLGCASSGGYDSFVPPVITPPYARAVVRGTIDAFAIPARREPQSITIVTTPVRVSRPPASFGRIVETNGTMRSW